MSNIDIHLLREKIVREVEQWKEKTANHYTIEAEARWSEANYILGILDSLLQEQQEPEEIYKTEESTPQYQLGFHNGTRFAAENFAKIIRANLTSISDPVHDKIKHLYEELTEEKMYQGYND